MKANCYDRFVKHAARGPRVARGNSLTWSAAVLGGSAACTISLPVAFRPPSDVGDGENTSTLRGVQGADISAPTGGEGARLLPVSLQEARAWGAESDGGVRAIVSGLRIVVEPDGALTAASDRLPASPSSVAAIPERLGAGFLFAIGTQVWRSDTWLGRATPIFASIASGAPIGSILVGLDRAYLRYAPGSLVAVDPRNGESLDLGPLPASPHLGAVVALDAWRALVVADLRGALVTMDAGASWHPTTLPMPPTEIVAMDDAFGAWAPDERGHAQWWLVRSDGQSEGLPSRPPHTHFPLSRPVHPQGKSDASPRRMDDRNAMRAILGQRPLAAAIEDGWPLSDGTAMVARGGAVARVRLSDGAVLDTVMDAFPLSPARCHGISLSRPGARSAFGFVCGEPLGRTRIYGWNSSSGTLVELRRFDDARQVTACGNGALAVRGGCAGVAQAGTRADQAAWCVMGSDQRWQELRTGALDGGDRAELVALSDQRIIVIRSPIGGDLATATLTIIPAGPGSPETVPVRLPPLPAQVRDVLRFGTWMDGFEERRPGVLGGWVDAGDVVIGIEIDGTGTARVGEYLRDAGPPIVSGRWALGWTASRRGFESVDGGMTWSKALTLPDPIAEPDAERERGCGPIGCVAAGWMRIGWGTHDAPRPPAPPMFLAARSAPIAPADLRLRCEPLAPRPPIVASGPSPSALRVTATHLDPPRSRTSQAAGVDTWGSVADFPSFSGLAGPALVGGDLGLTVEAFVGTRPLGRVYAWGPATGDWDSFGGWQVRWDWAWGGWQDARSSAAAPSPWPTLDSARRGLGIGSNMPIAWTLLPGDDPDHALLVSKHGPGSSIARLMVLESHRAPLPVQRDGSDSFPAVEGALRTDGRWFVVTAEDPSEGSAAALWTIEGDRARVWLRIPRSGFDARADLRLASRTDGRAVGLIAEGQPDLARAPSAWVVSVDLQTGQMAEPEALAALGASKHEVEVCAPDDPGWDFDVPYPGVIEIEVGDQWRSTLQAARARVRSTRDRACIVRIAASVDPYASITPEALTGGASPGAPTRQATGPPPVQLSVFSARTRFALNCVARR